MVTTTSVAMCSSLETPKPCCAPKKKQGRPPKPRVSRYKKLPASLIPLTAKERYWSPEECNLFEYLYVEVVDWKKPNAPRQISELMLSWGYKRTETQVRTHVQKWLIRLAKQGKAVPRSSLPVPLIEADFFQQLDFSVQSPAVQTDPVEPGVEEMIATPDQDVVECEIPLECSEKNLSSSGVEYNRLEELLPMEMNPLSE